VKGSWEERLERRYGFRRGMGGLLISTALTLVIIPVVYTILDRSE
jgi:multidrug efflux pump subunit AcrB